MRRRSKAAGCFLLVGVTAAGQQANLPKWPRVRVNVSILDQNDAPAVGVKADALEVTDGKKAVQDAVLRPVGDEPESVCLLVDMSGSTYSARNQISAELREFVRKLPAADEVCLADFSASVYVDAPLTTDRKLVAQGLSYLKSSGGSALLDALLSTARMMQKEAKYPRRVVLLVSDGGENASKSNADEVRRELHQPEAPVVYSLMNRSEADTDARARTDQKELRKLTETTGGLALPVNPQEDPVQAVDDLLQAVQGRYELEFTASDPVADGKERKLRVVTEKDLRKQKMMVVASDGYVAARP
jgi:VWFA-related protein